MASQCRDNSGLVSFFLYQVIVCLLQQQQLQLVSAEWRCCHSYQAEKSILCQFMGFFGCLRLPTAPRAPCSSTCVHRVLCSVQCARSYPSIIMPSTFSPNCQTVSQTIQTRNMASSPILYSYDSQCENCHDSGKTVLYICSVAIKLMLRWPFSFCAIAYVTCQIYRCNKP